MKHFIDKVSNMASQVLDTAVITDSTGKVVGKVVVRYTNAQIGWNNETGIVFHAGGKSLDFSVTEKHDSHNNCEGVFNLLSSIGGKVYDYRGEQFADNHKLNLRQVGSLSSVKDFTSFKLGNSKFNILWV